ncbi:MAG: aminotransferase class V-fold PLP-dependent enzyme [Candidatus Hermodarchaeota archaeon]
MDFEFLRNEIIGNDFFYETPFGRRLLTYADYTASGRSLKFIEKYLLYIQKSYANTHTEDDVTGRHMTKLLHKAEELIKKSLNAEKNCYIIPNGTGATGAIAKVQEILGIYIPPATKDRLNSLINQFIEEDESKKELIDDIKSYIEKKQPIIFVGPFEHHSNDIMWREALGEVIEIDMTLEGFLDLDDLEKKVSDPRYKDRYKIGSFSAASNVTGLISPVYDIARILHKYNAIACFDFAASGPYVKIDMNKDDESYLDAVFLSPHKFLGGPGSSGILIINKRLYRPDLPPTLAAGGTVDFVSSLVCDFSKDVETREKPGTPGVLQIIKAALSISLKDIIGIDKIEEKEYEYICKAFEHFSRNPNIQILGNQDPDKRVAIFSLRIKHKDKYLHPKLATKLLNDLFGIQSRAGCSCAGPYGHRLLNIDTELSMKYREVIESGYQSIKPGWLRVNFHYTMSEADFKFICQAIDFIATYGYLFIPQYVMNIQTGMWSHKEFDEPEMKEPFDIKHLLKIELEDCFAKNSINRKQEYEKYLSEALHLAKELKTTYTEKDFMKYEDSKAESLRQFYVNHME